MKESEIEAALERCYDAVVAPEQWADALHALARALDAACVMFYPRNDDTTQADPRSPDKPFLAMPASHDYRDLLDEYVRNGWYLNHYRAERGQPLLDGGQRIVVEHELATDEERRKSRTYNELYLRFEFPGFAMVGLEVAGRSWALPFLRGKGQGHFLREDAEQLARLAPHFRRLIHLGEAFERTQAVAGMQTVDRIGRGAVLLDWQGRVLQMNRQAEAMVGGAITIRQGHLRSTDAEADLRLQVFLGRALREATAPDPIILTSGRYDRMHVDVMNVRGASADLFPRTHTVVILTSLARRDLAPEKLLRRLFALTPAEARLAARLSAGEELYAAAEALGIRRETARSNLKVIFDKTDTHRQVELVLLLSRITTSEGLHAGGRTGADFSSPAIRLDPS